MPTAECDGEDVDGHDWEREKTLPWTTGFENHDERYQTGVFYCSHPECTAKQILKEERTRPLSAFTSTNQEDA